MQNADDSSFTLPALRYLLTDPGRALLAEARANSDTPAAVTRLRKSHPADAVHIALTLARLREKAARKFPEIPTLFSPQEALEQSTSLAVARHKAARFAKYFSEMGAMPCGTPLGMSQTIGAQSQLLLDACCGIGGDALALAAIAPVVAVDLSPIRLFCLKQNAAQLQPPHAIHTLCADIAAPALDLTRLTAFHIDPARRSSGKRHHAYEDMLPGPAAIDHLIKYIPAGAIKLSPAVDFDSLPPGHLELISEDSTVVQAVLYTGGLSTLLGPPARRTASSLKHAQARFSFTAAVEPLAILAPPGEFIAEVDPALHRAGLAPALARMLSAQPLNDDGGLITSPAPLAHAAATCFRHITTLPFNEKRLRTLLPTFPPTASGPVEVKSRGRLDIDTDKLQRQLSAATDRAFTVLLYRAHDKTIASITARQFAK